MMVKPGQLWCNAKGTTIRILAFNGVLVFVEILNGAKAGRRGWMTGELITNLCRHVGNNYQERPTAKALAEQRGCRKEDC